MARVGRGYGVQKVRRVAAAALRGFGVAKKIGVAKGWEWEKLGVGIVCKRFGVAEGLARLCKKLGMVWVWCGAGSAWQRFGVARGLAWEGFGVGTVCKRFCMVCSV